MNQGASSSHLALYRTPRSTLCVLWKLLVSALQLQDYYFK